jgi:proteasome-associated ATPase
MKEFEKKGNPGREPASEGMKGLSKFLPMTDSNFRRRLTEYEVQVQDLQAYIRSLETETGRLRKKMEDMPKEFMVLENKLREANRQLVQAFNQKLCAPPSTYGVYLSENEDGTVNILSQGRKVKVNLHPSIKAPDIKPGQELILNEGLNVVETAGYEIQGEVVILKELLEDHRAIVTQRADEDKVGIVADPLRTVKLKVGDHILMDSKSGYLLEKLPKSEVEDLTLEEVPDIGYEDIGGLSTQIESIKDAVELPYLYSDYYKEHHLAPPKGVLLYGPPGCGKTMIAKAVANNLAARISEKRGEKVKGFFLSIKGPELLNKYVGETERKIREIFVKAREKAAEDVPVVIFFDEMDALFRTRGSGISSDVETTIVPQLLAELDGVESVKNVIVIGASNRQDLIDPAILRPGRLDVKIKIERPDKSAAVDIFNKYMTEQLPIHESELRASSGDLPATLSRMIAATLDEMYSLEEENRFLEVTYANGDKEVLYFKDFASGAMIESIVRRAKKLALKRYIQTGDKGITVDDLLAAVREEFKENEDLPNTTNPDDWAKIAGKKGERIVYVKPLMGETKDKQRAVERVINTGQYL